MDHNKAEVSTYIRFDFTKETLLQERKHSVIQELLIINDRLSPTSVHRSTQDWWNLAWLSLKNYAQWKFPLLEQNRLVIAWCDQQPWHRITLNCLGDKLPFIVYNSLTYFIAVSSMFPWLQLKVEFRDTTSRDTYFHKASISYRSFFL